MKLAVSGLLALLLGCVSAHSQTVTISPSSLPFGLQTIGTTSAPQTATLTNNGTTTVTISKISLSGSANEFAQNNNCGSTVAAGTSCTLAVTFTPAYAMPRTGTVTVSDNASGSPQKLGLSGTGTLPAVKLTPANVIFAKQAVGTTGAARSVVLLNSGSTALDITSIAASPEFGQTNNCGASLAAGASCTISATFAPTAIWTRTGSITLTDSAADSPQVLPLAGMGTGHAVASLSTKNLTFASQTVGSSSSAQTVTLTNQGTDVLTINSILASGDYSQTTTCGSTLAVSSNCSISVTFTPSASGTRSGQVTLNDTDQSFLQTVTITGTGTAPNTTVAVSPRISSVTLTQTQQFSATIGGVATTDVTWAVDGIGGGNATVGTISSSGLYTPPFTGGAHQITATSVNDASQTATVPLTVTAYAGTFTYNNDNQRTCQHLGENVLTTGNV